MNYFWIEEHKMRISYVDPSKYNDYLIFKTSFDRNLALINLDTLQVDLHKPWLPMTVIYTLETKFTATTKQNALDMVIEYGKTLGYIFTTKEMLNLK